MSASHDSMLQQLRLQIWRKLREGKDLLIEAVPGSGKSTAIRTWLVEAEGRRVYSCHTKALQEETEKHFRDYRHIKFVSMPGRPREFCKIPGKVEKAQALGYSPSLICAFCTDQWGCPFWYRLSQLSGAEVVACHYNMLPLVAGKLGGIDVLVVDEALEKLVQIHECTLDDFVKSASVLPHDLQMLATFITGVAQKTIKLKTQSKDPRQQYKFTLMPNCPWDGVKDCFLEIMPESMKGRFPEMRALFEDWFSGISRDTLFSWYEHGIPLRPIRWLENLIKGKQVLMVVTRKEA